MTTKQIKLIKPEFQGSMGFEIECVFKSVNEIKVMDLCDKNSWQKGYDGSIRTTPEFSKESEIKFHYNLNELNEKLPEVQKLLELIKSGTKYGCGFHIHLSFEEICNYYKLASWKFVEYFQNEYTKYAKTEEEKARIQNSFCKFYDNKESYINNTNVQLNTRSKGTSAKAWERIGMRLRPQEDRATRELLLDDSINNMDKALDKDGTTGHLSPSDGMLRPQEYVYRGYLCQLYGISKNQWQGVGSEILETQGLLGGRRKTIETVIMKSEHQAGQLLNMTIDSSRGYKQRI